MSNIPVKIGLGLINLNYYVEDRGENANTRYKHFLKINIFHFWNIRFTIRSPHVYPIFLNDREYLPKFYEIK